MELFAYAHPATKQEAIGQLGADWNDSAVLAGGTDLISLMKEHVVIPKRVISIRGVAEWRGIRQTPAGVAIGALVTVEELMDSAVVKAQFPALTQAAAGIASPQIRNMGTVGGDLCQRPRCWYFRNGFGLLARDAKGNSLVPNGENKYHAIFGNAGPAYFVSASSFGPALIALDAKVRITGGAGDREVAAAEFFRNPKSDTERENVVKSNEVVTEIVIPAASAGMRSATYEVRQKESLDWPLAAASVALKMQGGQVSAAKIVLGHVAPTPWAADQAAKSLMGKNVTEATASEAGEAAVQGAKPLSQNGYKVQLTKVAVKRAVLAAAKGGA
ncbi:MAG TPA: FAD binding domain-containing protein [Candidatus Acidoferrales bacterium]|jgi:xanthine dehydrogenase YagS FAD-binding subunit|nr:FAD binding domain-containing protein [Candidatus Acidoferrales bacterium]